MKHLGRALWRVAVVVTASWLACAAAGAQNVSLPTPIKDPLKAPLKDPPQAPLQLPLTTESYLIPSRDRGVQLYVRNKRPQAMTQFSAARTVLFVHGATYPSETSFDLEVGGFSWMDYLAQRGWDAYLMDVRGYGRSTRPPEMSQPPHTHPPIANTDVAVRDLGAVVDHILARRGIARLSLIGWSWGTSIVGGYAAESSAKVERLVLYAPIWTDRKSVV